MKRWTSMTARTLLLASCSPYGAPPTSTSPVVAAPPAPLCAPLAAGASHATLTYHVAAPIAEPTPVPTAQAMSDRLIAAGASGGDLQVSLAWNGANDLDLHVAMPCGKELSFRDEHDCGGRLDVDANSRRIVDDPVENAFWPAGGAEAGNYVVSVEHYNRNDGPLAVSYAVRVVMGGRSQTYTGTVLAKEQVEVVRFDWR